MQASEIAAIFSAEATKETGEVKVFTTDAIRQQASKHGIPIRGRFFDGKEADSNPFSMPKWFKREIDRAEGAKGIIRPIRWVTPDSDYDVDALYSDMWREYCMDLMNRGRISAEQFEGRPVVPGWFRRWACVIDDLDYVPHDAQAPFHEDRGVRFRLLRGGTGSGKSLCGAYEVLSWCRDYPGAIGLVAVPAFRKIREIIIPAFEDLLGESVDSSPFFSNFNRSEMSLDCYNSSKIWLLGLDKAESPEGLNLDFCWVDEARLIPKFKDAWGSIRRRLRGSGRSPGCPCGAWITTTPDYPGSELHQFFEGREKDPESKVYPMSIMDNPHLSEAYVNSIKRSHTGGYYQRFVEGQFAGVGVGCFPYDYVTHVQGFSDFFDPSNMKRYIFGVDFGWTSPSAIVAIGLDGDGRAFVVDEVYRANLTTGNLIDESLALQAKYDNGIFWCDSSEPKTIMELARAGINARANKSQRDDSIRELGSRFMDAGDGRCRIYSSPSCVNLIDEIISYSPLNKVNDHAVDALRYALMGAKIIRGEIEAFVGRRPR